MLTRKTTVCRPMLDKKQLLDAIHKCSPDSAIFSVEPGYTDYSMVVDHDHTIDTSLPKQLYDLYNPNHILLTASNLSELVLKTFSNFKVTQPECDFLETATKAQANSYIWHDYRRGLITSSHFKSVICFTGKTYPKTIVDAIMQYAKPSPNIPALKWGTDHEDVARQAYIRHARSHLNLSVSSSGLVVNPLYPYIGASPDGVVTCQCCGQGLLEIKCPYKFKDVSPIVEEALNDKNYCLKKDKECVQLSLTHPYYHQVQGQMAVKQLPYCDFVCWTTCGLFVQRITQDKEYLDKYLHHFRSFFIDFLLPELLTHKHKPGNGNSCSAPIDGNQTSSTPVTLSDTPTSKVYCFCQEERTTPMIACDNKYCEIEWFHLNAWVLSVNQKVNGTVPIVNDYTFKMDSFNLILFINNNL